MPDGWCGASVLILLGLLVARGALAGCAYVQAATLLLGIDKVQQQFALSTIAI